MADIASLQLKIDSTQAKTAQGDLENLSHSGEKTEKTFASMAVQIAGAAAVLGTVISVAKSSVEAANEYQNSLKGLASVARYAGEDIGSTLATAAKLSEDGILSTTESVTALKNLLAKGFSTDEAVTMIGRFKDAAAFGRQSSLEFGQAVVSATEGIKNENSMLVDNAGVTKNVAKMVEDYAKSLGKTVNSLSEAEKRQAIYNGLLQETEAQAGNAALAADGLTGKQAVLSKSVNDLAITLGTELMPAAVAIVEALGNGFKFVNDNGIKPFLFLFNNVGITIAEVSQKAIAFFNLMSDPKTLLTNPIEAVKKFQDEIESLGKTADEMRIEAANRISGTVSVDIGVDTGKRRTESPVKKDTKEAEKAAKDALKIENQRIDSIEKLIESMHREEEIYGKTASQIKVYDAAKLGATETQLEEIKTMADAMDMREKEAEQAKKNAKEIEQANERSAKRIQQIWDETYSGIQNGVANSVSKAIVYGNDLKDSMESVAASIADGFISAWIKIALQKQFVDKSAALAGATGIIAQAQTTSLIAMQNAYASTLLTPGGIFTAPAAAAEAFAMAEGMASSISGMAMAAASARDGYDIPAGVNPVTQLHEKEMVLPQAQADVIRGMARNGGAGGQIIDNTVINIDSRSDRMQVMKDVQRMIEAGHSKLVDRLQRQRAIA